MKQAHYYPAFLNVQGKKCIVIGGGPIAARKVTTLLEAGARVTVIAREFSPLFNKISHIIKAKRQFRTSDINGAWLVVAATNDKKTNSSVAESCRKRNVFVNVVDQPGLCSFIAPSVVKRGNITFAVSTGGASPALAKFIRKKIQSLFGPDYIKAAGNLAKLRPQLLKLSRLKRMKKIKSALEKLI